MKPLNQVASKTAPSHPTLRRSGWLGAVVIGIAISVPAFAQDSPARGSPPPRRAADTDTSFALLETELKQAERALAPLAKLLGTTRSRLTALPPEAVAPVHSSTVLLSKRLGDRVSWQISRQGRARTLAGIQRVLLEQIGQRRPLLSKALATSEKAAAASALLAAKAETDSNTKARLAKRHAEISAIEQRWQREAAALAAEVPKLTAAMESSLRLAKRLGAEVTISKQELKSALRREALVTEFQGREPSVLVGLLAAKNAERGKRSAELKTKQTGFDDIRRKLRELDVCLNRIKAPNLSALLSRSRVPEIRKAETAAKLNSAFQAYHRSRLDILKAYPETFKNLLSSGATLASALTPARQGLIEIEVIASVIESRVKKGELANSGTDLATHRKACLAEYLRLGKARNRCTSFVAAAKTRAASIEKSRLEAEKDLKALERQAPSLTETLAREQRLAHFVSKVEGLNNDALRAQLSASTTAFEKSSSATEEARQAYDSAGTAVAKLIRANAALEDPIVRRARDAHPVVQQTIERRLRSAAGLPPESEGSKTRPARRGGDRNKTPSTSDGLLAVLEAARREAAFSASRSQFLDASIRRYSAIEKAHEAVVRAGRTLATRLEAKLEHARETYGCSQEYSIRIGLGIQSAVAAPKQLARAATRETISRLESEIEKIGAEITRATKSLVALRLEGVGAAKHREINQRIFSLVGERQSALRQQYRLLEEAVISTEKLPDSDQKLLLEQARTSMEQRDLWWDPLLAQFGGAELNESRKRVAELYYQESSIRRRLWLFKRAKDRTRSIIALIEKERDAWAALLPILQRDLEAARESAARVEAAATTQLDPSKHSPGKSGTISDVPTIGTLTETVHEAKLIELGLRDFATEVAQRVSTDGFKAAIGAFERATEVYNAQKTELEDELRGLEGHGELTSGAAETVRTKADERWYVYGEIGVTRQRYRDLGLSALRAAMLSLVLVPAFAILVVFVSGRAASRVLSKLQRDGGSNQEDRDREQRLKTLVSVFGAAWNALVVTVASIYVLKQLGVDVTPIVASAGVVGLALAFGAQNLIKDFLAGFFILLENQYKIGDFVTLGAVEGYVESISLRLTVLRDREGKRHFVPNGEIKTVTNESQVYSGYNLDIGISYAEDPDRVIECLRATTLAMSEDDHWGAMFHSAPVVRGIESFGDSAVMIRVHIRTRPGGHFDVARELRSRVKRAFDREGIEIPFPQRTIHHQGLPGSGILLPGRPDAPRTVPTGDEEAE